MADGNLEGSVGSELVDRGPERIKLINKIVEDCSDGFCTARMIVEKNGKTPVPCCAQSICGSSNCGGRGWCENREIVYWGPMRPRMLIQWKLIEKSRYLDCIHEKRAEEWSEAEFRFWNLTSGSGPIFRYAYDELAIRNFEALCRVAVYSVVDNPPNIISRREVISDAEEAFKNQTESYIPSSPTPSFSQPVAAVA